MVNDKIVNDKIVNDLVMEKKQYINPLVEIMAVSGGYMMYGPASTPADPFAAPKLAPKQTPTMPNDSVPVF